MAITAAVAIDDWMLPVFKRILDEAGFSYEQAPGLTKDTLTLMVSCESSEQLQPHLEQAQRECMGMKR